MSSFTEAIKRAKSTGRYVLASKLELAEDLNAKSIGLTPEELSTLLFATPQSAVTPTRYCLVQDDDCHDYVIEADHLDEWEELTDDEINDGPSWAWQVGGAPNQVTFTDPEIFGERIESS